MKHPAPPTTPVRVRQDDIERLEAARRALGARTYAEALHQLLAAWVTEAEAETKRAR